MHFLLVNQNPAVSRLITLSVEKLGFEIDETTSFEELPLESYDIVFVDNEQYDEFTIDKQKEFGLTQHFVSISPRGEAKPENMNSILEKPFLPTDFIDLVLKIEAENSDEIPEIEDNIETFKDEDLETLDDINLEDEEVAIDFDLDNTELESLDDLDEEDSDEATDVEDLLGLDEEMLIQNEEENSASENDNKEELDSVLDSKDIDEVKQLLEEDLEITLDDLLEENETTTESVSSVEDLEETDLLKALESGTDCLKNETEEIDQEDDVTSIEEEIQEKVSQSIKNALEESSMKEALKGMKVNVSITFEEDS